MITIIPKPGTVNPQPWDFYEFFPNLLEIRMTATKMADMLYHQKLNVLVTRKYESQALFAKELGIPRSTMNNYVKGKSEPDMATALKIARGLGVDMEIMADETIKDADELRRRLEASEEEKHILWLARTIGIEEAVRRLTGMESPAPMPGSKNGPEVTRKNKG